MGLFKNDYHVFSKPKTPEFYSCHPPCGTRKLEDGRLPPYH